MRLLLCWLILFFSACSPCWAQVIEAINEDSTRQVQFRLNRGVECEVNVANKPVIVRGELVLIDSTSFRVNLGDGYYTTVLIDQLIRMRYHRYTRQRLAAAGAGSGLLSGNVVSSSSVASIPLVAVSALTGLGIVLASQRASFRHKDPSSYQGWTFRASSQR